MLRLRVSTIFLVVSAAFWTSAGAQNYGEFAGAVQDSSGGVLPGVSVTVTNPATGFVRTVVTNDTGDYRVPFLNPGVYNLQAELPGFSTASRSQVTLQVGDVLRIDFVLQVGEMTEIIEVAGQTPLINVESAEVATVIEIHSLYPFGRIPDESPKLGFFRMGYPDALAFGRQRSWIEVLGDPV